MSTTGSSLCKPERERYFAQIFRDEIVKRLNAKHSDVQEFYGSNSSSRVFTSYMDNDDVLEIHFVEDIQRRAELLPDETFITYDNGYQFFTTTTT